MMGGSGCVTVYEPLSGMHRPIAIDTNEANFKDLRLAIYCPPGNGLGPEAAATLCHKVGVLFENQGAQITTATQDRRVQIEATTPGESGAAAPQATDLVLELRAHDLRETNDPISWLLCYGTFTLVPAVTEDSFAQDVIIRDRSGFLLGSDTLRGRIVRRFGIGTWVGNQVLDLVWRNKPDKLTPPGTADRALSTDLYQQLSQLVFNAKMRWEVLQEEPTVSKGGAP